MSKILQVIKFIFTLLITGFAVFTLTKRNNNKDVGSKAANKTSKKIKEVYKDIDNGHKKIKDKYTQRVSKTRPN